MQGFTVPDPDHDAVGAKLRRLGLKATGSGAQAFGVDEVYREIADDIDSYSQPRGKQAHD